MLRILAVVTVSIMLLVTTPVQAWFDGGHMSIGPELWISFQERMLAFAERVRRSAPHRAHIG